MPTLEIKVANTVLGTVDTDELTGKAVLALERCKSLTEMIDWIEEYAGGDAQQTEDVLSAMLARDLHSFAEAVSEAIGEAVAVPKANGRRSSRR